MTPHVRIDVVGLSFSLYILLHWLLDSTRQLTSPSNHERVTRISYAPFCCSCPTLCGVALPACGSGGRPEGLWVGVKLHTSILQHLLFFLLCLPLGSCVPRGICATPIGQMIKERFWIHVPIGFQGQIPSQSRHLDCTIPFTALFRHHSLNPGNTYLVFSLHASPCTSTFSSGTENLFQSNLQQCCLICFKTPTYFHLPINNTHQGFILSLHFLSLSCGLIHYNSLAITLFWF